jgi:delta24-sterol reductase
MTLLGINIPFNRKEFYNYIDQWIEYAVINYRWIFVCLFLLPASVCYEIYFALRTWLVFKLKSAPSKHQQKVRHVQQQVRDWNNEGRKTQMCTARPGYLTMCFRQPKYKKTMKTIEVNLVDILEIDTGRKTVRVEPLVTMGQLTSTLNAIGWTIPVVPELDDLTVGGLINGAGVETSSHKYGLFQHNCLSYEIVTSDGALVKCSMDENPDLFYSIPWSHGTLGFMVAAELKIIPAKPYVKLTYLPCNSFNELVDTFEKEVRNKENEFVEGIAYDIDHAVVMKGEFADSADYWKINPIGRWYKPWFFKHVESYLTKPVKEHEFIPLRHYYHRHTRSLFWELQDIIPFGNKWWFRWLCGMAVPPKVSFLKLTQPNAVKRLYDRHHVLQDLMIPMLSLEPSLKIMDREVNLYPVWLCPFVLPQLPGLVHPVKQNEEFYVDIGLYGTPKNTNYNAQSTTRRLESFVRNVHGFQMMYADSYMTREEFRTMFDHTLYDQMRIKYNAEDAFPEAYYKVSKSVRD